MANCKQTVAVLQRESVMEAILRDYHVDVALAEGCDWPQHRLASFKSIVRRRGYDIFVNILHSI